MRDVVFIRRDHSELHYGMTGETYEDHFGVRYFRPHGIDFGYNVNLADLFIPVGAVQKDHL
jgi:hypothetical protein